MRVLVATVTAGGGHLQAAAALEEAWRALRPGDALRRVDVLDFTPRVFRKAYAEGYVELIKRAPELYGAFFRASDDPVKVRKATGLKRALARFSAPGFARLVRSFKPHAVLAPHFLPLEALGGLRLDGGPRPLAACVVTDFEAHALWMEPRVDDYFVAAQETKDRLVARGASPGSVHVTGIPVSARFSTRLDRRAARRRHGLRDDLPVVLVLSGGFGMGPVEAALAQLDRVRTPVQLLVVCGRNEALRARLAVQDRTHPTRVLGFTKEMHELMNASDLIVSKPGGLTSSEALALGRPLLILDPIPGQEEANSDFLLGRGAAAKVNRPEDIPARVDRLLGSGEAARLARAAKALGRPHAAQDVCRIVARRLAARG